MHKKCCKKGECKKEFCKKAGNDNTGKCHPKKDDAKKGPCPAKDSGKGHCGFGNK